MWFEGIQSVDVLDLDALDAGTIHRFWLNMIDNGIGQPVLVPVLIARGTHDGPVVGITAAVHGNELNGISVVQRVFDQVDVRTLRGTLIGVPVVNVPSLLLQQRRFVDDEDLNRIFPGRPDGNHSEIYAHRFVDRVVHHLDVLLDLHTASFGRINSYYIRANLSSPRTARLADLQNAEIIVDVPGADGTLRSVAADLGIDAITVEVGDPNRFQKGLIRSSLTGVFNVLSELDMIDDAVEEADRDTVQCSRSFWMHSDVGGILRVLPDLTDRVEQGEVVARVRTVFGDIIREFTAPQDAIVVGKAVHPVCPSGGRIVHLGIVRTP